MVLLLKVCKKSESYKKIKINKKGAFSRNRVKQVIITKHGTWSLVAMTKKIYFQNCRKIIS